MLAGNLRLIGRILKTHGIDGKVLFAFENWSFKNLSKAEWIFIEIDGCPVPFFILSLQFTSNTSAIIQLQDVNTLQKMQSLIGCSVFLEWKGKNFPEQLQILEHFLVIDELIGQVGEIIEINDLNGNIVAQVLHANKIILIPLSDEIIIDVNKRKKTIKVRLPEGLIDIYH